MLEFEYILLIQFKSLSYPYQFVSYRYKIDQVLLCRQVDVCHLSLSFADLPIRMKDMVNLFSKIKGTL